MNKYELLSLIEQELCSRSSTFLRASGSSWSLNVHYERILSEDGLEYKETDMRNMDFFRSQMQKSFTSSATVL